MAAQSTSDLMYFRHATAMLPAPTSSEPSSTATDVRGSWQRRCLGHTLVLEDDVSLPDNFAGLLASPIRELPEEFDVLFVGTTTPFASLRPVQGARHLLVPDAAEPNGQALLGFWG